jgi:Xaa-Pro aminopeptidase
MDFLSHNVRDERMRRMHALMDELRLDALIITSSDFFEFATSFKVDVEPWERPVLVVIPRTGEPVAIMNELSTHHFRLLTAQGRVWVTDVQFYVERRVAGSDRRGISDFREMALEIVARLGLTGSRIGFDDIGPFLSGAAEMLPNATLIPCKPGLRALRWVKHAEEVEIMRHACALSDWGQDRYRENIRPGRLVQELDFQMASLMVEEGARRFPGSELEIVECFTLSGPASAAPHGNSARCGARIEKGDVLVNIIVPRLNGLLIENERTWIAGPPSLAQRRYYDAARAANEAGIEAAVAGSAVSGIDEAAQREFERAGFAELSFHRTGHGIGIICHEYPDDMAFNDRPLLTNEVYSVEPGIYVAGVGGFRIDDTVVIGAVPEIMTKSPRNIESFIIL